MARTPGRVAICRLIRYTVVRASLVREQNVSPQRRRRLLDGVPTHLKDTHPWVLRSGPRPSRRTLIRPSHP
eukprot:7384365-Prymnesium_polylepis.2